MLPVPLNSSKMTSSMRLPVSIRAVATMVRLPPPSMLRAAPKNFLGLFKALASMPPERTLPEAGVMALWARARRVMESSRITTSLPISTMRLAFSSTMSATLVWRSGNLVEGGGDDFALDVAAHVGYLFRPLVDQQNDENDFRVVDLDGLGNALQDHGLARCAGRRRSGRAAPCRWGSASSSPGR